MQASPFPSVLKRKFCHSPQHGITCFKAFLFSVCMDSFWGAAGTEGCILEDGVCFWRQLYLISQVQWLYIFWYSYSKTLPEYDFSLWFLAPVFLAPSGVFPARYGGAWEQLRWGHRKKGTSELGMAVPHHHLAVLQLPQWCHSPGTLSKTALTLQRLENPTHFLA